ncbi:hypothetical protein OH76DRAFT_1471309 [Lentinus brumalis]|uniref:Uncharacterized protein n=1 Tax=Lentinus brumalis TaxID=2498619 RepID=A0A371DER9_9APHY|nr:hypothetical protein OH76DRAFT_1471309 [Polyporus brumalis]
MNALTLIALLPPELLSLVFVYLVREHFEVEAARVLATHSSHLNPSPPPNAWIKISHVCRDWRTTALATPRLWSYIMITDNFPVKQFLARSKQAPLSVLAKFGPRFQDLFARVLLEFTRLQILRIICPPWSIATVCENISGVAPLLETIDIHGTNSYGYDAHPSAFLPHFLPNRLPRLRTLHVSNIRFAWDNPIFTATLTKLVISGLGYTSSRHHLGSFDIFLDALERMSSLQILNLYQGVIPSPPSHFRRKVALPSLASLKLVVAADNSYRLLEHVMLPTATRYQIIGAEGAIRIEDLVVALRNHFSDPTPLRALCLRRDYAGNSRLKGWRDAPNPVAQSSNNILPRAVDLELRLLIDAPLLTSLLRGPGILSNVSVLEVRMRGRDW